jgi:hypothetical protein
VLRGVVPVEEDGSACFDVPAGRNLFFQALDEDFMEVQRMRTFVNFEPGERRSCIGCHEHRRQAPPPRLGMAFGRPPSTLSAQPGEVAPRPLYYPTDVQPIWDQHCVRCHDGKDKSAPPALGGQMTTLFNRSYENLLQGGLVATIREWAGANYAMQNAEAVPPYTHGSHSSRIVQLLKAGHYDVQLSREEWIKLVTWIDCGAPYYGSYYGRRNLKYRGQPDFRPIPTLASACGIPPDPPELVSADPLPAELLAWWPMNGTQADSEPDASQGGHDARAVNASRAKGPNGCGARRFDGTGYIECTGLGSHEAVSIAMWVRADTLANRWNPLLFCHDGQSGAIHFSLLADGTPNVAINTGDWNWNHTKATSPVKCGEWHHVTLVCDARYGGSVRFYVDGQHAGDKFLSLGIPLDLYGFRIGAWNRWEKNSNSNFRGTISDVRIYAGMLTDERVAQLVKGSNG